MPESPIGSIIAYAGEISPPTPNFDWEDFTGWLRCDGRAFRTGTLPGLFNAIQFAWGGDPNQGIFNIPDLQGYFLRGVDANVGDHQVVDIDRDERFARRDLLGGKLDPNSAARPIGNRVGSFQPYATAEPAAVRRGLPPEPFFTDLNELGGGTHRHQLQFQLDAARDVNGQDNTVAFPGPDTDAPTRQDGAHQHKVIGGNNETRPVNAYVHWIIRFK
jgi:hypothetical protein